MIFRSCRVWAARVIPTVLLLWFLSGVGISQTRPNVLLVMADDLGYSDLGCYGGEIETPHLNRFAREGIQLSHFRATPMCVTSRIALMAGMPMEHAGGHGYARSMQLPILMKRAGYRTMMTGKWHAGKPDPRSRVSFDRSFGFLGGMTDSFVGGPDWFLDSEPFDQFGKDFYSTDAFAEKSIEFMKEAVSLEKPFFMYVAFNAPHHPCQAPKSTVDKYAERYQAGYESIRRQRYAKQIELGLVDAKWPMSPLGGEVRRWGQLSEHRRAVEASRMAAYAAAVDEVDSGFGKMVSFLRESGIEDNTLVIFLSDNGGDYSNGSIQGDENQIAWQPGGNPSSSNGWAAVKATPFRFYKHSCHEGGLAVPMIMRPPSSIDYRAGTILRTPASIVDLYPTLIALVGQEYPTKFDGHTTRPLAGKSLWPKISDGIEATSIAGESGVFSRYQFSRSWTEDEWKAVRLYGGAWQLFDLRTDRGETRDLAREFPERLQSMIQKWNDSAARSDFREDQPLIQPQRGWGWHRLQMILPHVRSVSPINGSETASTEVQLKLVFAEPIDFRNTEGKTLRLYCEPDEGDPVWQADPDENHPSQGLRELILDDLPPLTPGRQYFLLSDPGWLKVGGKSVSALNDGAFWWRFTTPVAETVD